MTEEVDCGGGAQEDDAGSGGRGVDDDEAVTEEADCGGGAQEDDGDGGGRGGGRRWRLAVAPVVTAR